MLTVRLRTCAIALVLALLGACGLASPAGAATKPYSVVISCGQSTTSCTAPGGPGTTFDVAITNRTTPQALGSADLKVPLAFANASASVPPPATATAVGNTVQLRNLNLAFGATLHVQVTADVPCTAGTFQWSVVAKQDNNFNGPPGNDFTLDTDNSNLITSVTGPCGGIALQFADPPALGGVAGKPITSASGGPVTVEVVDAALHRVTTSTAPVTMSLGEGAGTATLNGTTTVTAVNGLATFKDLSIDTTGGYTLVASSPGLTSIESSAISIAEAGAVCTEDVTSGCSATLTSFNGFAKFTVSAVAADGQPDSGALTINQDVGPDAIDCRGYDEILANDFSVDFLPNALGGGRNKIATFDITKEAMQASTNNGLAQVNICFEAPFLFVAKPDTLQETAPGVFRGLLPDCATPPTPPTPPCVSDRKSVGGGAKIVVQAPGGTDDPRMRG